MEKEELLSAYDACVDFINHTIETIKDDEHAKTLVFGALFHASAVISSYVMAVDGLVIKPGQSQGKVLGQILIDGIEEDLKKIKSAHAAHGELH